MNDQFSITIRNLSFFYKNKLIFSNLDTCFHGGMFNILLGASGVGKSSLLKMIAGLLPFETGHITVNQPILLKNLISYMGQQDLLMPWLTVMDNITLGSRLRGQHKNRNQAEHILEEVGLSHVMHHYPSQLSGGMKQRAALARTLYEDRPIILMDEPFSALDSVTRTKIQDYTARLLKGKTVILITHDPFEACRIGESIQILAGNPAKIIPTTQLEGKIPRDLKSTHVQQAHANLLSLLIDSCL